MRNIHRLTVGHGRLVAFVLTPGDAGCRHRDAASLARRCAAGAPECRRGLRREGPERPAEETPGDSHEPVRGHPEDARKAQPNRLPAAQTDGVCSTISIAGRAPRPDETAQRATIRPPSHSVRLPSHGPRCISHRGSAQTDRSMKRSEMRFDRLATHRFSTSCT